MEEAQLVMQAVSTVGFPIVSFFAVAFLWYRDEVVKSLLTYNKPSAIMHLWRRNNVNRPHVYRKTRANRSRHA